MDYIINFMKDDFLNILAFSGVSFIFFILFACALFFAFNIPVMPLNFLAANVFSLVFVSVVFKNFKKTFLAHILNFIIIFILALYFANTLDFTSDCMWYHIPAINFIKEGWNPFNLEKAYFYHHNWVKFFAKGPWIINASIASFFGSFEAGKLSSTFLIYVSILFSYFAFRQFEIKKWVCVLLSILAGFNMVSMVENHTFLVDGFLSSSLVILISSIVLYYKTRDCKFLIPLSFSMCLALNSKLSVVAYVCVIIIGSLYFIKFDKKYLLTSFFAGLISLFAIGFNPYGVNLIKHKNPVYPIGSTEIDIVKDGSPIEIRNKTRLTKFVVSLFSKPAGENEPVEFKIPFAITKKDLASAHFSQALMCGFGFLFSGVILLSILFLALSYKKPWFKEFIIFEGILFLSVIINPECWWARFVPHFYLCPLVLAAFLLIKDKEKKYEIFGFILLVAICANAFITGALHYKEVFKNQAIQNRLTQELRAFNGLIYIDSRDMRIDGFRIRLDKAGIRYTEREIDPKRDCEGNKLKYATIPMCIVPVDGAGNKS